MSHLLLHYARVDHPGCTQQACISNPAQLSPDQAMRLLRECLVECEYFLPHRVRLPYSPPAAWHVLLGIEAVSPQHTALPVSLEGLLLQLKSAHRMRPIAVRRIPAFLPIRLAVSWFELLRRIPRP